MANLTIAVDDEVLSRARARALERGTSVNAVLAAYLAQYAGADPAAQALTRFLALAESVDAGSGPSGREWTREGLYDRSDLR